ncbi:MAG: hypothetical protein JXQ76_07745, partial [Campylobacterales bacterium]|nr:hypothetical protein [Campylobacterales bacterium]
MDATTLLTKAKSQLTTKHPYFGMLASRLKHEPKEEIESFASNGERFLYNPSYIESCSMDELFFILTNCVMHHILAHQQRKLERKGYLWQLATDYAINNMLHANKFKIPQGANYNREFRNMYAEEIYEELKKQIVESGTDSYDDAKLLESFIQSKGGDSKLFKTRKKMAVERNEEEWDYADTLAKQVASKKSSLPKGLERFGKKVKARDIDWRFELYNAINR